MKKIILLTATLGLSIFAFAQQKGFFDKQLFQGAFPQSGTSLTVNLFDGPITFTDGDWQKGWTNWTPQTTDYGDIATYTGVSGDIASNTTWSGKIKMVGPIHVLDGATLTIAPGTIIRGDVSNLSYLCISKGGKIYAVGTKAAPIVMTSGRPAGSRTAGDWAGILILGKSKTNTGVRRYEALPNDPLAEYGGGDNANESDSSGVVRYMRVEFAGYNYLPDQEINGFTFGAVGNKTHIDFVQVSYSRDDSYEWFGGTNDHKCLVAFAGVDDEFDMDEGYRGHCQYLLGVRHDKIFETAAGGSSHGFEHDNNTGLGSSAQNVTSTTNPQPGTHPIISNATLIGPRILGRTPVSGNKFGAGFAFRTGDESCVYNSIVTGYTVQYRFFHPSANIKPSAQYKALSGVSESKYNVFLKDGQDVAAGLTNGGIISSQANTSDDLFDATTGLLNASGTAFSDANAEAWLAKSTWASVMSKTISISGGVFAQPDFYTPSTIDFTLGTLGAAYAATANYTASVLANNSSDAAVALPYFLVSPGTLPLITVLQGASSAYYTIKISAANLTGSGITVNAPTNFMVSKDGGANFSTSLTTDYTVTGIWVKYLNSGIGANQGFVTLTAADNRVGTSSVFVRGQAIAPATPYVSATAGALPNFWKALAVYGFQVKGNLLKSDLTVTAPANFQVSLSSTTGWAGSLSIVKNADNKVLPTTVFVAYTPAAPGEHSGTSVAISSTGAKTEQVMVYGNSNLIVNVGPVDANGNIPSVNPTLPVFNTYLGTPSFVHKTYIKASNVPASGVVLTYPTSIIRLSTDNFVSGAGSSSITLTGVNGELAATPIYIRYDGSGGSAGNPSTIAVGGSNVRIGVSKADINTPTTTLGVILSVVADAFNSTISGSGVISTPTSFVGKAFKVGTPVYSPSISAANYLGNITSILSDTVLVIDKVVSSTIVGAAIVNNKAAVVKVASTSFESNKDFNTPTLVFRNNTLSDASTAVPSAPIVVTVSGNSPFIVTRNLALPYGAYFEISADNITWAGAVTLTGTISNVPVYIRYNPTGDNVVGSNPNFATPKVLAIHTSELLVGGVTISLISSSAPDLFASTSTILGDNATVAQGPDFATLISTPSSPVPVFIKGSKLVGNVTVSSSDAKFEFSTDGATFSPSLSIAPSSFSVNTSVWVRFNPGTSTIPGAAVLNISSAGAISQLINISGYSVSLPVSNVNVLGNTEITLTLNGVNVDNFSVSGDNLTSNVVVTAPTNVQVSTDGSTYTSSVSLAPATLNYGSIATSIVYVKYAGTVTVTSTVITITAANVEAEEVTLKVVKEIETAIDDALLAASSVVVYPNPTEGAATLAVDFAGTENITVNVYDVTGASALYFTATVSGATYYPISGLTPGLYIIQVSSSKTVKTVKLIVK